MKSELLWELISKIWIEFNFSEKLQVNDFMILKESRDRGEGYFCFIKDENDKIIFDFKITKESITIYNPLTWTFDEMTSENLKIVLPHLREFQIEMMLKS